VLQTPRLLLRRFTDADIDALFDLDADPAVTRYLTGGVPTPRAVVERHILPEILHSYRREPAFGKFAAVERATGSFIGWLGLEPSTPPGPRREVELGYRLRRAAWGRGYATEGGRALVAKAFAEPGVERVWAQTMAVNTASRRVMEKCGLRFVRLFHLVWDDPIHGHEDGEVEYELRRADRVPD
jgi:RimJ/RimL family protein N-acetyltransferase